jgi:hypothetical protein
MTALGRGLPVGCGKPHIENAATATHGNLDFLFVHLANFGRAGIDGRLGRKMQLGSTAPCAPASDD